MHMRLMTYASAKVYYTEPKTLRTTNLQSRSFEDLRAKAENSETREVIRITI